MFAFLYYGEAGFLFPILLLFDAMKKEMFLSLTLLPHSNSWEDIAGPVSPFLEIQLSYISEKAGGPVSDT